MFFGMFGKQRGWKLLRLRDGVIVSGHDRSPWVVGEWREVPGRIMTCDNGFHCSPKIRPGYFYVSGDVVALVEGAGSRDRDTEKTAYRRMRIVRAWKVPGPNPEDPWRSDAWRNAQKRRESIVLDTELSPNASDADIEAFFEGVEEIKAPEKEEVGGPVS